MTPAAFNRWLSDMKLAGIGRSDAACARLLGVSANTVVDWKAKGTDLRTALACRALLGNGWRPIETAPSDGRRILVTGGRYAGDVELVGADGNWWHHYMKENPGQLSLPTHWMPLPEPPTASDKASSRRT